MLVTEEMKMYLSERIVKGINPEDCWKWTGGKQAQGYGTVTVRNPDKHTYYAHRVAYALYKILIDSLDVLHSCDTPECCNPLHLFQGTHLDNMKDKAAKGRAPGFKGTTHPMAKLTDDQVRTIYLAKGMADSQILADRYRVDRGLINCIWNKKNWTHITDSLDVPKVLSEELKNKIAALRLRFKPKLV